MTPEEKGPTIGDLSGEEPTGEPGRGEQVRPESVWSRILNADSPNKPIGDYNAHPMNYNNEDSTGRIIRGAEGIFGSLDKAVIDIIVGVGQKIAGYIKKANNE